MSDCSDFPRFPCISCPFLPLHPTLPSSDLVNAQALLLKLLPCFQSRSCIPNANGRHVNVPSLRVIAEPTFSASFDLFYPASVSNMHFLSKGSSVWKAQRGSVFFGLAGLLFLINVVSICLLDARCSLLLSIFSSSPLLK